MISVNPTFGDQQSACIEDPSLAVAIRTASVSQSLSSAGRPPQTPTKERATTRDFDALLPPEIAQNAELLGAEKTRLDVLSLLILAVLADAFIALGAMFATTTLAGADGVLPFGVSRLLAGAVFCLGRRLRMSSTNVAHSVAAVWACATARTMAATFAAVSMSGAVKISR